MIVKIQQVQSRMMENFTSLILKHMGRQTKFRGKSLSTGEWVYGYYVYCAREVTIDTPIMEHRIYTIGGSYFVVNPKTVGQYIGLKDRNGKEIFKGDILIWYANSCGLEKQIVISDPEIILDSFDGHCFIFGIGYPISHPEKCEIIGNIHDNPNLLTQ